MTKSYEKDKTGERAFKVARIVKEWAEKTSAIAIQSRSKIESKILKFAESIKSSFPEQQQMIKLKAVKKAKSSVALPSVITTAPTSVEALIKSENATTLKVEETAQQLSSLQFNMFKAIDLHELAELAWTKPAIASKQSPNVCAFISHFNKIGFWVATKIVSAEDTKHRVRLNLASSIPQQSPKLTDCVKSDETFEAFHQAWTKMSGVEKL